MAQKVKCPSCSNKRLMDVFMANEAEIEIKCPKCGKIIRLSLQNNKIKAKAV